MDSTVDAGPKGFLGIFGSDTAAETDTPETEHDDAAQDATTAAAPDAPEESDDQDLSADELVAARIAASLEADGIEIPEPTETDAGETTPAADTHPLLTDAEGEPSLDSMTPEQLRALAEEAITLRGEVSTTSRQEAARKVAAAEAAAVAQVQAEYERSVLAQSNDHYPEHFTKGLSETLRELGIDEETVRTVAQRTTPFFKRVVAAQQQWEAEQYEGFEERARNAALNARLAAPEFRQYAAEQLVAQAGLPAAAVAEVLKTTDTRQFEARVQELVAIRDALLAERNRNQAQLRVEGNKRLRESAVRTAATGRPRGGKPPDYKGVIAEGASIISQLRSRS